jgi:ligand-binding SRPBCC domain-containing protein
MGLTYSSVIDADRDEVFSWHTRPREITRLIPPWQPVRVLHEAGSLPDGRATLTLPGGLRWVAAGPLPPKRAPKRSAAAAAPGERA